MHAGLAKVIAAVKNVWSGVTDRLRTGKAPQLPAAASARLGKAWDHVSKLAANRDEPDVPPEMSRSLDLGAFNSRARIGRQPDGESWRSVIVDRYLWYDPSPFRRT